MEQPDPWRPVRRGFLALGLIIIAGTLGYVLLGLSLLDAIYQTVTTVSTVGFREVRRSTGAFKVLTMALILFQRHVIRRTDSMAVQADSAHYVSDFLANIAVIVALVLSSLFGWWWVDPLFGLLVAVFIAYTALTIGRTSLDMLMDREMDTAEREKIKAIVRDHPEVLNLHDLRTRIAGKDRFIQFHLELPPEISLKEAHRISDAVEAQVIEAFPEAEVIIHQDPYGAADRPSPRFG